VAQTEDSFIDEVAEAVRRERLAQWFRRWGWAIAAAVIVILGATAAREWSQSRAEARAEARGEALLTALESGTPEDRLAALSAIPATGEDGLVAAFLLAAEKEQAGDSQGALNALDAVALDADVPPLYRDLAALKAEMIRGPEGDPAALEALAAPGGAFRLLAQEQLALLHLENGRTEEAATLLRAIEEDAEAGPRQLGRVAALLATLGLPAEPEAQPEPEAGLLPPPEAE
jgi:hypothetical protein